MRVESGSENNMPNKFWEFTKNKKYTFNQKVFICVKYLTFQRFIILLIALSHHLYYNELLMTWELKQKCTKQAKMCLTDPAFNVSLISRTCS